MPCREEGSVPPVEVKVRGSFGARGRHLGTAVRRKNQGPVSPLQLRQGGSVLRKWAYQSMPVRIPESRNCQTSRYRCAW